MRAGAITGIIGPNGAGKTSIFNCISGVYHPQQGSHPLHGRDVTRVAPDRIAGLGIARTFQNIELFPDDRAGQPHAGPPPSLHYGTLAALASRPAGARSGEPRGGGEAWWSSSSSSRCATDVTILPYGLQKRVELGRALAMAPRLLMLDEPVAGMNLEETEDMARFIIDIRWSWATSCSSSTRWAWSWTFDRITVLAFGHPIAQGTPAEIQKQPRCDPRLPRRGGGP